MARFRFPYVLTLSLSTLALGAVGCSNGSSPTEPAFDDLSAPVAATSSSSVASTGEKRQGADDPAGDDRGGTTQVGDNSGRRGSGADDPAGDDRGGRRGGRGGNDDARQPRQPRQPRPNAGVEFEGVVLSVNGNTLTLAGGTRVIVNGQTQWIARGDLFNLNQVASAVAADRPTRVEGRGIRQGNGNFVAQTIKAEVDD